MLAKWNMKHAQILTFFKLSGRGADSLFTHIAGVCADYKAGKAEHVDILDHPQQGVFFVTFFIFLGGRFGNFHVVIDCVLGVLPVAFCNHLHKDVYAVYK
jgi:hypothetical protein